MTMHTVICERRRALGLTQEQVAEYLGVSAPAVHKWEKGLTCPDVALLPRLARFLKIDLNTLFCFRETLTQQEIMQFQEEVAGEIKEHGIQAGAEMAKERMQEYPDCGALFEGMAQVVQGSLLMSGMPKEETDRYQPQITAWYERAMDCGEEEVKNRAGFMVAAQYLQNGDDEKAQQVLDRLPEPDQFYLNKHIFQADIFGKQGKSDEAAKLLQKCLLQQAYALLGIIWRLIDVEMSRGEENTARKLAEKSGKVADALDLWGCRSIGMESVARKTKNVQESLCILKQMLAAAKEPWVMDQSPLYDLLYPARDEDIRINEKVLPLYVKMLESDPEYDFLREEEEFQELVRSLL